MTYFDVVKKLIGPVHAIGSSDVDASREQNLKAMTDLIGYLVSEVQHAAKTKDRPESSMARIGKKAQEALDELREQLS